MSPSPLRLFVILGAGCLAAVTAVAADLTPDDWAKIARGDVVVRRLPTGEAAAGRVWAAVLIPASVPTVWAVMLDVEHAPEFVPGLRRARRIERLGPSEIIEHTVKYAWLLPEVTYRFRADYRPREQIDFQRVSGDLRALSGTWSLRPTPDGTGTVVTYSVMLDPGFLVPQWLVRQSLAHNLPAVLRATRQRATRSPREPVPRSRRTPPSARDPSGTNAKSNLLGYRFPRHQREAPGTGNPIGYFAGGTRRAVYGRRVRMFLAKAGPASAPANFVRPRTAPDFSATTTTTAPDQRPPPDGSAQSSA